jgi:hypothetical protein
MGRDNFILKAISGPVFAGVDGLASAALTLQKFEG